jgi:hypothetical protein
MALRGEVVAQELEVFPCRPLEPFVAQEAEGGRWKRGMPLNEKKRPRSLVTGSRVANRPGWDASHGEDGRGRRRAIWRRR